MDVDGIDVRALMDAVVTDRRVWYVIHDRRIWSRTNGWKPKRYTGSNPHVKHVHVSIQPTRAAREDTGHGCPPAIMAHGQGCRLPEHYRGQTGEAGGASRGRASHDRRPRGCGRSVVWRGHRQPGTSSTVVRLGGFVTPGAGLAKKAADRAGRQGQGRMNGLNPSPAWRAGLYWAAWLLGVIAGVGGVVAAGSAPRRCG